MLGEVSKVEKKKKKKPEGAAKIDDEVKTPKKKFKLSMLKVYDPTPFELELVEEGLQQYLAVGGGEESDFAGEGRTVDALLKQKYIIVAQQWP
ncbi:hypothetical protein D8674_008701 [Pyrus ussuriensis x Pyrus communis]|uniref:Uncharacterized protein n=1 Tax=Pyrus ussuriensis x Pyrus communis TaxID=2448454 RepID=A0A5N5HYB7_9ROSA|nr:hypothetical protein D8674_008701 [Pyrus ussuriensis x Pyrus communis]